MRPNGVGYFYLPTILSNVPKDAACLRDEIFGPVAAIQSFSDEDEVIARANDTEYGLVAYVYAGDMRRGMNLSERLEFGMIGLNRGLVSDPAAPFGGVKQSGLGREGGREGMLEFKKRSIFQRSGNMRAIASPSVRRLARERNIDIDKLAQDLGRETIAREDVLGTTLATPTLASGGQTASAAAYWDIDHTQWGDVKTEL